MPRTAFCHGLSDVRQEREELVSGKCADIAQEHAELDDVGKATS